ncbi:hypothetical protein [Salinarimonas soli]|uniref:Uncharacterized protein n=1 Tax=Salinarimonas soli TaxID=1638099 RepID=A0A5B2V3L3_9HYPH|nr:hypothetical protein [Salinarimonas soli]KAA2233122.1 hypothetical protein F0L46_24705 [Salinarimonas soli]
MPVRSALVAALLLLGASTFAQAAPVALPDHVAAAFMKGPKWKGGKVKAYRVQRGRAYGHRALPGRRLGWYKRGYRPARAYRPARVIYYR